MTKKKSTRQLIMECGKQIKKYEDKLCKLIEKTFPIGTLLYAKPQHGSPRFLCYRIEHHRSNGDVRLVNIDTDKTIWLSIPYLIGVKRLKKNMSDEL